MAAKVPVWQIVKTSYRAVFRDFDRFLARTWVWITLIALSSLALEQVVIALAPEQYRDAFVGMSMILMTPLYTGVAVQWHRYVQLGEDVRGGRAIRLKRREWIYLGFELGLLLFIVGSIVALMPLEWSFKYLGRDSMWTPILFVISIPIVMLVALHAIMRCSLVFPLLAVGETEVLKKSWHLTKNNAFALFLIWLETFTPSLMFGWTGDIYERLTQIFSGGLALYAVTVLYEAFNALGQTIVTCLIVGGLSHTLLFLRGNNATHPSSPET